jgi:carbon-monoxide dehydrogenase medium subunit
MTIASRAGTRVVPADEFFQFHMTTAVEPDELLLAVEFDRPAAGNRSSFQEFALRKGDFCLAAAAVTLDLAEDHSVRSSRVVVAGVAPTPIRLTGVEDLLVGSPVTAALLAQAQRTAADEVRPTGDIHADADYRRHLASVLVRRALADATAEMEGRHAA